MSEEELELLITLDEPWDGHEDTFNHLQAENTDVPRPRQSLPTRSRPDQRTEVIVDNDSSSWLVDKSALPPNTFRNLEKGEFNFEVQQDSRYL